MVGSILFHGWCSNQNIYGQIEYSGPLGEEVVIDYEAKLSPSQVLSEKILPEQTELHYEDELNFHAESFVLDDEERAWMEDDAVLITGSVGGDPAMFFFERGTADNNGFTPGMILVGAKDELMDIAESIYDSVASDRFQQGFKNYKNNVWRSKRSF